MHHTPTYKRFDSFYIATCVLVVALIAMAVLLVSSAVYYVFIDETMSSGKPAVNATPVSSHVPPTVSFTHNVNERALEYKFNVATQHGFGYKFILPLAESDRQVIRTQYADTSKAILMIAKLHGVSELSVFDDGITVTYASSRDPNALTAKVEQIIASYG